MGTSHSEKCNKLAKAIWEWCISRSIWISLAHIPGKLNFVADFELRRNQRESEWMLDSSVLANALKDSNLNQKLTCLHLVLTRSFRNMFPTDLIQMRLQWMHLL